MQQWCSFPPHMLCETIPELQMQQFPPVGKAIQIGLLKCHLCKIVAQNEWEGAAQMWTFAWVLDKAAQSLEIHLSLSPKLFLSWWQKFSCSKRGPQAIFII